MTRDKRQLWNMQPTDEDRAMLAELHQRTGIQARAEIIRVALRHFLAMLRGEEWRTPPAKGGAEEGEEDGPDNTPPTTPTPLKTGR